MACQCFCAIVIKKYLLHKTILEIFKMDVSLPNVEAPNVEAPNVEAPNVLAAPKKVIVRKTIPKKYLDYLKFAFVAMNEEGNFAEIVKLKEPVDNIISNVKAIVDDDKLGDRINEIRKELLRKPREKKTPGAPKASSKKRKSDGEAVEDPDTTLVNTLVDGLTVASEPKTPRKKATTTVAVDGVTATKAPRKKAKSIAADPIALAPVAKDLTNDLSLVANNLSSVA